jgi:spore maturation protein CgeB
MKVVLFCHSFVSCWNHGNAHFLRGVVRELIHMGHAVTVYEPEDGWSRVNALADGGADLLAEAATLVPGVTLETYQLDTLDLDKATHRADVVIAHEWNPPALIAALGQKRANGGRFTLLFHDTHHRAVTAEDEMSRYELDGYDGVLAFGEVLREIYERRGWGRAVFTWHEAADTALFRPQPSPKKDVDLIWIGNWGDDERSAEIMEFLVEPVRALGLSAEVRGVRYPRHALDALRSAGIRYGGWIANAEAPEAFARHEMTIHVPRAPYRRELPGIPTIRVFEALACGIPLISAPWTDSENLFRPGTDYLVARDGAEMRDLMAALLRDPAWRASLTASGLETIRARHTCRHRVDELLAILACFIGKDTAGVPADSPPPRSKEIAA